VNRVTFFILSIFCSHHQRFSRCQRADELRETGMARSGPLPPTSLRPSSQNPIILISTAP
jgi:hypothetical protein